MPDEADRSQWRIIIKEAGVVTTLPVTDPTGTFQPSTFHGRMDPLKRHPIWCSAEQVCQDPLHKDTEEAHGLETRRPQANGGKAIGDKIGQGPGPIEGIRAEQAMG